VADLKALVDSQEVRYSAIEKRLTGVEAGSNQVVMFGIFLLCVTFSGAIFQLLLSAANADNINKLVAALDELLLNHTRGALFGEMILVFAALGVLTVCKIFYRLIWKI
jgi:hypothetical protein